MASKLQYQSWRRQLSRDCFLLFRAKFGHCDANDRHLIPVESKWSLKYKFAHWSFWFMVWLVCYIGRLLACNHIQPQSLFSYIHTSHSLSPKDLQTHLRYSAGTIIFYLNNVTVRNIADVTCVVNPLVAFYYIHRRSGEVIFICFVPETTRDVSFHEI
jgi:hypothetical protein